MPPLPDALLTLFAQAPAAAESPTSQFLQFLPLLSALPIFYFLLIRPQQQQEKKRRAMIDRVKKGDKVLTSAGMYGTVLSVDTESDKVMLRLDDDGKVKIAFTRASIVRVLNETAEVK